MKIFSLTIKHFVKNFIIMMGFNMFTYNIITSNGVLYCGGEGCGGDEEECECGEDCGNCEK